MNARFDFGGYEMVINDDGHLEDVGTRGGAHHGGHVGFQMISTHGEHPGESGEPKMLAQFFMAPSHARAVASAMLSAANAAKG